MFTFIIIIILTRYNYREKSTPMIALWCPAFSHVIMSNCIMPETQQPIIVIIYSPYLLKDLVEL